MVRDLRNRRRFESLENRLMLASDAVAAAVIGGNLTIVGDGKADAFLVSGDGMSDGKVTITGYTGSDGNQTLIDGKASVNIAGVTSITVLLGNGNVTVSVADLDVAKNLTITGGSGNETIDIGKLAPLTTPSPLFCSAMPSRSATIFRSPAATATIRSTWANRPFSARTSPFRTT